MSEEEKKELKQFILDKRQEGKVVVMGLEGPMSMPLEDIIKQPADGLLYDLNRLEETTLTFIDDLKWINDFAVALVIRKLKSKLTQLEGEPCSICGSQPALLVDAKEKGTYWMCAECMFEKILEKMELEADLAQHKSLQDRIFTWGRKTFGHGQRSGGVFAHLAREIKELGKSLPEIDPVELADCTILLFELAGFAGTDLLEEVEKKFKINQGRKWGPIEANGSILHIEEDECVINGFDKYLEYQYRQSGDFYTMLFRAIMQADTKNTTRLAKGFPSEVEAYRVWTRVGVKEFVKHVSPDHDLLSRFKDEYALEMIEGGLEHEEA